MVLRSPDSAYARKIILGSVPLMMALTYLLFGAYQRSKEPPYREVEEGETVENYNFNMKHCVFVFLWVALLCCVLMTYCLHTMPRKRALLRQYLEEGLETIGDVFYPEDQTCYGCCSQYGTITYQDPDVEHAYIRRSVRLFEHFSREWVPILILPNKPFSGHAKSDIEMAFLSAERQKSAMSFLATYAGVWFIANMACACYVMYIIQQNVLEDEFPNGWLWILVSAFVMPVLSIAVNFLIFQRYMRWMAKGDARALKGKGKPLSGEEAEESTDYQQMDGVAA